MKIIFVFILFFLTSFIQSQTITIQGNKEHSTKELEKIIASFWDEYKKDSKLYHIDDIAYEIKTYYQNLGYAFVEVDYKKESEDSNNIIITIDEHKRVNITLVSWHSVNKKLHFDTEELKKLLTVSPIVGKNYFIEKNWIQDKKNIENFYINRGYLDAKCKIEYKFTPEIPQSTSVDIDIIIDEGMPYYLVGIELQGNKHIDSQEILDTLKLKLPQLYERGIVQKITQSINNIYRNRSYAQVKIKSSEQDKYNEEKQQNLRTIQFQIEENNSFTIEEIELQGEVRIHKDYILSHMLIHTGELFHADKIFQSRRNIVRTNLFLWVDIKEEVITENTIKLTIQVEERDHHIFNFSLGYDTAYGVTAGIEHECLGIIGTGLKSVFSIDGTIVSSDLTKREAKFQLIEPELLGSTTWSARWELFGILEENPTYDNTEWGTGFYATKKFNSIYSLQLGYEFTWTDISNLDKEEEEETEEGVTIFSVLSQKFIANYRDNDAYPTTGSYHSIEFNESLKAIGSDVDYWKVYGETAWYFSLYERVVLSFSIRAGVITPFGDSDTIPIQRRFFSGGANTVRSYKTNQMPPFNNKHNPKGGEGIFLFSTEIRIPIYGNFGISPFFDTGEIIHTVRNFSDYKISHLRYGVGLSLWYQTPIGPIRFDMGFNPDKKDGEKLFAWFISIGFSY